MSKIGADIVVESWMFEIWPCSGFGRLPYPITQKLHVMPNCSVLISLPYYIPYPSLIWQKWLTRHGDANNGIHGFNSNISKKDTNNQRCARLMSRESNLTRLWLKWVESELSRPWKSWMWVESESNHVDRHLSQNWVNCILLESKLSHQMFWRENVKILHLSVALQGKNQPKATFDRTPPPNRHFWPN